MNADPHDVLVVGAGVFGTAAALELRGRGHDVTLLDPGPIPHPEASSTDVSKMVRMDYGSDVFYHELAEDAMAGWDGWNAMWPRPLYHESGFLVLSAGPMEPGGFEHDSFRVLRERGYDPPRIDGTSLAERYPAWAPGAYPDGYLSVRGGWAESGEVVRRLATACVDAGVTVREGMAASLETEPSTATAASTPSRVTGVRTTTGDTLHAETTLVCAGAWTPTLLPWLSDVMWATAQPVLHFAPDDPERYRAPDFPPWAADIAGSGWYGFPALPDGRLKVAHHGAGRRVDPRGRGEVSDEHVDRTRAFFRRALPGLADAPVVGRRICLYCDTFDGDLWIDRDEQRDGLVVAAGGSGHAFKFAPVLGLLIANAVEGVDDPRLSRFARREPGPTRTEEARFDGQ